MGREDEIRSIAYNIWQEQGCIEGHDCEHWYQAEVIWEQQHQKPAAERSRTTAGQPARKGAKTAAARKKTREK